MGCRRIEPFVCVVVITSAASGALAGESDGRTTILEAMVRTVFFSYSHKDESLRDELEIHLSVLKRQGAISTWHDRRILAGGEIDGEISEYLEAADIILLLVSPHFLASSYINDVELKRALERHEEKTAFVIPVILHPCDWHHAPFGKLLACPKDGKPVSKHPNINDAFLDITQNIRRVIDELQAETSPTIPPVGPRSAPVVGCRAHLFCPHI